VVFDFVEFAGLDQGGDDGPILRASIMSREECVFAVQGNGSDPALDGIVVELDTTVIKEPAQPVPVFCNVFQSLTGWRFGRDAGAALGKPKREVIDDGF